jgi:hypothetical protein
VAQRAGRAGHRQARHNDFSGVRRLLDCLRKPFDVPPEFAARPPD